MGENDEQRLVSQAKQMLQDDSIAAIAGMNRLLKAVACELHVVRQGQCALGSSRIPILFAIYSKAKGIKDTDGVMVPFRVQLHCSAETVRIDLVLHGGNTWVVFKRGRFDCNQKYLKVIEQCRVLINASQQNTVHCRPPRVFIHWITDEHTISDELTQKLLGVGVTPTFGNALFCSPSSTTEYGMMNIDISTIIALVSDISHRLGDIPCIVYDVEALKLQREREHANPILPILQSYTFGKQLIVHPKALERAEEIIEQIGGPTEQQRFLELKRGLRICPFTELKVHPTAKIKSLQLDIFGLGCNYSVPTLTSNHHMQASLRALGMDALITVHEPRSLIEKRWLRYIN